MTGETSKREAALLEARRLICVEREGEHGDPNIMFERAAKMWSGYLGVEVSPVQVCDLLTLLKMSRLSNNAEHHDSRVDAIGYLALGGEVV